MAGKGVLLTLAVLLALPVCGYADSPYKAVEKGNELFEAGEFDAAGQQYMSASAAFPEAAEIFYNQGNVLYKQRKFLQAMAHYTSALQSVEGTLESRVKYNLGNVEYRRALIAMSSAQDSMLLLRSAITYYRDSLAIDPQQPKARYNLELAHRLMHELYEQLQQDRRDSADDGRNSDRQSESDESKQRESEERQSRNNKQQDEGQAGSEGTQSVMADSGVDDTPEDMDLPEDMTMEEAEMKLDEIRERARKISETREDWRRARMRDGQVEKYW